MTIQKLPPSVRPALLDLQQLLQQFWSKELPDEDIPIEFWKIGNDEIFFDALQYLPSCMYVCGGSSGKGHSPDDIARLPEGFRIALAIFELEEGFDNEGWTAISNLGEDALRTIISAYQRVGLVQRAAALERVLAAYLVSPDDEDAFKRAAAGQLPDLRDDDLATRTVMTFLRSNSDTLFGSVD
jgi:hypothetical protein